MAASNPFRTDVPSNQSPATLAAFEGQLANIAPQFLGADFADTTETDIFGNPLTSVDEFGNTISSGAPSALDYTQQQVGGIADQFQDIGTGESDPRFENFRQAQLNQLGTDQTRQEALTSDFFNRRGLEGSSAELNQLNNLGTQFGQRRQNITSQIGMQELGRQDQALSTAAQLRGKQFGFATQGAEQRNQAQQSEFDQQTVGLESLTLPFTLETARHAASGDLQAENKKLLAMLNEQRSRENAAEQERIKTATS